MKIYKQYKSFDGQVNFAQHMSSTTKTTMKFSYFLPNGEKPKKAIIWLSGLTCNEENFITKAGAQKYLAENNMMIICPDTSPRGLDITGEDDSYDFGSGAGFYVNATSPDFKENYQMYDYILKDIVGILNNEFNINDISISGHSMGGHGALVLGLREPNTFNSVSAFSPIVNPINSPWGQKAFKGYLNDNMDSWKQYDSCELILSGSTRPDKILIDQGTSDEFLENQLLTNNFSIACAKMDQKLELNYREGYDHSYYFINSFIENHIKFFSES